jgi:site-specific DNA recombinase
MKRAALYLRVSTDRQVGRAFSEEGYSVETQREACQRRARQLEAEITAEYVDYGDSARVANRPKFQALLSRIREQRDLDLVIVYNVARFARNVYDDVMTGVELERLGVELVSATEHFDNTPFGKRMRRYLAADAEFYSESLSVEVKRGLHQKAKLGGTPGPAPIGYLNVQERDEATGKYLATVEVDPKRAPHIRWAFVAYATGAYTLDTLYAALKRRGLRTRRTAKQPARPLSRSHLARLLRNPYYCGTIRYGGIENPNGQHESLIDRDTFDRVQRILDAHAQAGEKDRKHHHYLKGTLYCGYCGSRLTYARARGKSGGIYWYFACVGRVTGTGCELPYLPAHQVENQVTEYWQGVAVAGKQVATIRAAVSAVLAGMKAESDRETKRQRQRVATLDAERDKLMQAFYADAVPMPQLKREQDRIAGELAQAEQLVALASEDLMDGEAVLHMALDLLEPCAAAYVESSPVNRRIWNQTFFHRLNVRVDGIESHERAEPVDELTHPGFADRLAGKRTREARVFSGRGSKKELLAEGVGFEPTRRLTAFKAWRGAAETACSSGFRISCHRLRHRPGRRLLEIDQSIYWDWRVSE